MKSSISGLETLGIFYDVVVKLVNIQQYPIDDLILLNFKKKAYSIFTTLVTISGSTYNKLNFEKIEIKIIN